MSSSARSSAAAPRGLWPAVGNPRPRALWAREARTGRTVEMRLEPDSSPLPVAARSLIVAYDAPAALGCYLSLGWPLPPRVLDLEAEFRWHVSGLNEAK